MARRRKKNDTEKAEKQIDDIIARWNEAHGKFVKTDAGYLPVSPELQYRIGESWKGRNKFFGIGPGSPEYKQNIEQDMLEDEAFERWSKTARSND